MSRIYIAGPVTGLPEYNCPAFTRAAATLRNLGYHVESPHEPGHVEGWGKHSEHAPACRLGDGDCTCPNPYQPEGETHE